MKRKNLFSHGCLLCALLMVCGCVSCASVPPVDSVPDFDESLPAFAESAPTKTGEEWRVVQGDTVKLPDLCTEYIIETYGEDPQNHPIFAPGFMPYFRGEIKKIGADYLVVEPIVNPDPPKSSYSYSEELLKHAKCCVVPLWVYEMNEFGSISADKFAVGDQVKVCFDDGRVGINTEYGGTLVIRVVYELRKATSN